MKYRSLWPKLNFRSKVVLHWLIFQKYDICSSNTIKDIRQNHWTMKYRSQWPTCISRSNVMSYRLIIRKYAVHTANSLQGKFSGTWNIGQWSTNILRSHVGSYWLIIPKYEVQLLYNFQGIRQNHWTMSRSQCATNILRWNIILTHNPKVWCSYTKRSSRYKAKSLDHER